MKWLKDNVKGDSNMFSKIKIVAYTEENPNRTIGFWA